MASRSAGDPAARLRFAPSPTGPLHVGNARTALFNWLAARRLGGAFIYRVEDTDRERSRPEFEASQMDDLRWLGLEWQEGPDVGGASGPYRQSERASFYREAAASLEEKGLVFPCYCTDEELEMRRERALADGRSPHYDGTCLRLTDAQRRRYETEGRGKATRFHVPGSGISVRDLFRADVTFGADMVGDFVILRADGLPTYNFACVVDDRAMAVTHVLRGEDHLSNTVRQVMLYEALAWEPPRFGHLPLVLGPDREKLSKRHGDISLGRFRREGYLPAAVRNALALLGWSPGENREILTTEELVRDFDLARVRRSASVFDVDKLNWIGQKHVQAAPAEEIAPLAAAAFEEAGIRGDLVRGERLLRLIRVFQSDLPFAGKLPELAGDLVREPVRPDGEAREAACGNAGRVLLRDLATDLADPGRVRDLDAGRLEPRQWMKDAGSRTGLKGKDLFQPIRGALTGTLTGRDLGPIIAWLGSEGVIRRLEAALLWTP